MGDPLERLAGAVEFELVRPELEAVLDWSDCARDGRRVGGGDRDNVGYYAYGVDSAQR